MAARLPVVVVRSKKRRKTIQAVLTDGTIRILVPHSLGDREISEAISELVPRLERRFRSDHIDLVERAAVLGRQFDLPEPTSVVWVDNQQKRWGSCDTHTGDIRLSNRLADYPPWVLDYVLVHELAHLLVADHSAAFRALVDRYPRAERARGYLMAMHDQPGLPPGPSIDLDRPEDTPRHEQLDDPIDDIDDIEGATAQWDEWPEPQGHLDLGLDPD